MKKVLLGTSAIALAGAFATPAAAVEWDAGVGGSITQHVGVALGVEVDNVANEDFDGVDVMSNSEIVFAPSITLDNGLQFGANVQLEANTSGDQIDESYVFIDGSFGEVLIGSENSAGYKMTYAAPNVTAMPINSGSSSAFIPFSGNGTSVSVLSDLFRNAKGSSFIEVGRNNDSQRITYFSPRFAGFQLGASYARDGNQDSSLAGDNLNNSFGDIFDFGANYVNSFGGIDVAVSGRYGFGDVDGSGKDPEAFAFGANVGFAGVTVGYAFAENNDGIGAGSDDAQGHSAGVSYETGPWGVSATYYLGEGLDADQPNGAFGNDETYQAFHVGGSYSLAKGVGLSVYGLYAEGDEDTSDDGSRGGDDVEGFMIGTAVSLSF